MTITHHPTRLDIPGKISNVDGRVVLAAIDMVRTARDRVYDTGDALTDIVAPDSVLTGHLLKYYGLAAGDSVMLLELVWLFIAETAVGAVPNFPADWDQTDTQQLGLLPSGEAYSLLAAAAGKLSAKLAAY